MPHQGQVKHGDGARLVSLVAAIYFPTSSKSKPLSLWKNDALNQLQDKGLVEELVTETGVHNI